VVALGTYGIESLVRLLDAIGIDIDSDNTPAIGIVVVICATVGLLMIAVGAVKALVAPGPGRGKWLFWIGATMLLVGAGPLLIVGLAEYLDLIDDIEMETWRIVAMLTFPPALLLLIAGAIMRAHRVDRDAPA
jgi:MFS family permease